MNKLSGKSLISFFTVSFLMSHQNSISMDLSSINKQFTNGSAMVIIIELVQNELRSQNPEIRIRAFKTILFMFALYLGFLVLEKTNLTHLTQGTDGDFVLKNFITILSIFAKIAILKLHREEHEDIIGDSAIEEHLKKNRRGSGYSDDYKFPEPEEAEEVSSKGASRSYQAHDNS